MLRDIEKMFPASEDTNRSIKAKRDGEQRGNSQAVMEASVGNSWKGKMMAITLSLGRKAWPTGLDPLNNSQTGQEQNILY